jgi:3-oxoacyl-[acyl-carrier-protein] synthase-1
MANRIFITGIGLFSSIGNNVEESLASLLSLRHGLGDIEYLDTIHKKEIPVSGIRFSDQELGEKLGISDVEGYTRTSLIALIAAREAAKSAQWNSNESEIRSGVISATTVGGMATTESIYHEMLSDPSKHHWANCHDCGDSTEKIAELLGAKDFVSTISTACSSSANAILLGARMIKAGILDRVIAGGADALSKFTINGFNTLKILDSQHCRPFDDTRTGLNLGEGAGYLVLESEDLINRTGKKPLGELKGYGNTCDAYHQTASSPDGVGAFLAMQKALASAHLQPEEIDYVNAHGTGTPNNDLSEGRAMNRLFNGKIPPFSSTKSFTGHTLAAAGGIEAVLSILSLQHGIIYPNLNFLTSMNEIDIAPETILKKGQPIKNILSNSFGFGGNNSALVFSKV